MGILDILQKNKTPNVSSILPPAAQNELMSGRLPILRTRQIFMNSGEICHYMDSAVYEKEKIKRHTTRRNGGYSLPGLLKGTRIFLGNGGSDSYDEKIYEQITGKLFITNQRIIFVGNGEGFDENIKSLIAITPYANCIELQFPRKTYRLFVPNGNLPNNALQLIK